MAYTLGLVSCVLSFMTAREPANVDDVRAQAAERLLERKRMGLESAIEALEAVGNRVELPTPKYPQA